MFHMLKSDTLLLLAQDNCKKLALIVVLNDHRNKHKSLQIWRDLNQINPCYH